MPEATAPRATYAAVSYVADDICESACSERQKKMRGRAWAACGFFSANTKKLLRMFSCFLLRDVKGFLTGTLR